MSDINPFSPIGNTVSVSASTGTANVALTSPGNRGTVVVYNDASTAAFVNFGTSSGVTASTSTSMPIASGGTRVFSLTGAQTYAAAILATGTGSVYFTTGLGV